MFATTLSAFGFGVQGSTPGTLSLATVKRALRVENPCLCFHLTCCAGFGKISGGSI